MSSLVEGDEQLDWPNSQTNMELSHSFAIDTSDGAVNYNQICEQDFRNKSVMGTSHVPTLLLRTASVTRWLAYLFQHLAIHRNVKFRNCIKSYKVGLKLLLNAK